MADTSVDFAGVRFKNPILAASADSTGAYEYMAQCIEAGAGGIVAKSMSDSVEMANQTLIAQYAVLDEKRQKCRGKIPRLFTFYCRAGMAHAGWDDWMRTLEKVNKLAIERDCILIGSMGTTNEEYMVKTAKAMEAMGLKMIELDAGCPHPDEMKDKSKKGLRLVRDVLSDYDLTKAVADTVSIPVIYKLTPQMNDLLIASKAALEAGCVGVTITNRFLGFAVDIESGLPQIHGWAGVGGPWTLPLSLRWVSKVHQAMPQVPISGSNGVYDWADAVQFIMSGAATIQCCSVLMVKGIRILSSICKGLEDFMDRKGYKDINSMIGIATKEALSYDQMYGLKRKAVIDAALCNNCEVCIRSCFYDGLRPSDGTPLVTEYCIGCELCQNVCPIPGAIEIKGQRISFEKRLLKQADVDAV